VVSSIRFIVVVIGPEPTVSTRKFAHPEREETVLGDRPRLALIFVSGRRDSATGEFANRPWESVEQDVGEDAGDQSVGDTTRAIRSVYGSEMGDKTYL
jgi:hypothetical protein